MTTLPLSHEHSQRSGPLFATSDATLPGHRALHADRLASDCAAPTPPVWLTFVRSQPADAMGCIACYARKAA